jgi:hypothetical protein
MGAGTRHHRSSTVAAFALFCAALPLGGCGENGPEEDPDDAAGANIIIQDANNYQSQSSLSIPTVETASATDLDICWTDAVDDLQCHELDPQADVDNVALLRFLHLSEEEVEERLTAGQLAQSEVDGYLEFNTDHTSTCAKLSSMSFFGTAIDVEEEYMESSDHTYMLLFAEGTTPGVGARTMTFVRPTATSTNTTVAAPTGCGLLEFSADLSSAEALGVPAAGPWVIDWRNITSDGQGNPVVFENIDGVLIGFYEGMTAADLEAQIFDLELLATSLWEIELTGGRTADLAKAKERESGARFSGFERDEEGLWVLGLMCNTCQNPAPIVLATLQPGGEDS